MKLRLILVCILATFALAGCSTRLGAPLNPADNNKLDVQIARIVALESKVTLLNSLTNGYNHAMADATAYTNAAALGVDGTFEVTVMGTNYTAVFIDGVCTNKTP